MTWQQGNHGNGMKTPFTITDVMKVLLQMVLTYRIKHYISSNLFILELTLKKRFPIAEASGFTKAATTHLYKPNG